jgi:hypothetical protein
MNDKISTTPAQAKIHTAWKNRIKNNKPVEGDYNFVIWKKGGEVIYQPPADGAKPSVFMNGEWIALNIPGMED